MVILKSTIKVIGIWLSKEKKSYADFVCSFFKTQIEELSWNGHMRTRRKIKSLSYNMSLVVLFE